MHDDEESDQNQYCDASESDELAVVDGEILAYAVLVVLEEVVGELGEPSGDIVYGEVHQLVHRA